MDAYYAFDGRELANELSEISQLTTENEQLRESLRLEAEAGTTAWALADDFLDQRNALEAERDALRAEVARLANQCQILILQKEEIRHTYQRHLGAYLRLVRESMLQAVDAGVIPQRLADDVNALRAVA